MEEDGSVAGIVCRTGYRFNNKAVSDDLENKTGKKSVVRATKGVMLAAGGFSRDIFFRQIQDPRVVPTTDSTNQPGATAGVLIKALGIGAAPVQLCWLQFLPYCNPREKGFGVSVNFTNHACMDLDLVVDPQDRPPLHGRTRRPQRSSPTPSSRSSARTKTTRSPSATTPS